MDAARKPLLVSPQQWPQLKQIKTLQGTGVMRLQAPDTVALRTVSPASQQSYFVCMSASDFYRRGTSQALIYPMIALCVLSAALLAMTIFRAHQRRLNAMSRQNDDLSDKWDQHAQLIRELVLRKLVDGSIRDENGLQYHGDESAICQLCSILLDNAVKYAAPGPIRISLKKERHGTVLRCSNACSGIEPDETGRLFDRFYRPDMSRSSATGGFGIGLSIARGIVEAHGGTICAQLKPGPVIEFTAALK